MLKLNLINFHLTRSSTNNIIYSSNLSLIKGVQLTSFNVAIKHFQIRSIVIAYFPTNTGLPTTFTPEFPEWFAGTIDGDGHFIRHKASIRRPYDSKATGLEITIELKDLPLLQYIQKTLNCGSIRPVGSGRKAYDFTVRNKAAIIIIANCVNGRIRNTIRLPQFIEVCKRLDIVVKDSIPLMKDSFYFAGFFDADGSICYSLDKRCNNRPNLSISISNKYIVNLQIIQDIFGGNISFCNSEHGGLHTWRHNREGIFKITDYFRDKCKSNKSVLFFIVDEYYHLLDLHAYKSDSIHYNEWLLFMVKWKARDDFRIF